MNEAIRNLEPTAMWNNFADLNAVPRPSKKEERVIAFKSAKLFHIAVGSRFRIASFMVVGY